MDADYSGQIKQDLLIEAIESSWILKEVPIKFLSELDIRMTMFSTLLKILRQETLSYFKQLLKKYFPLGSFHGKIDAVDK